MRDAIRRRHIGVLDKTIAEAQSSEFAGQLSSQIEAAEKLRDHLKELNQYSHDVLEMEQATISELRSYQRPPSCVHDVMAATYMLLGEEEERLSVHTLDTKRRKKREVKQNKYIYVCTEPVCLRPLVSLHSHTHESYMYVKKVMYFIRQKYF